MHGTLRGGARHSVGDDHARHVHAHADVREELSAGAAGQVGRSIASGTGIRLSGARAAVALERSAPRCLGIVTTGINALSIQAVYDWIDAHADECISDLQSFVRQPSVSAQNIGLRECATLIRDMMRRDGLPADFHELEQGPPVVFGKLRSPSSKKTLLCYSHCDVQPPEPLDAWTQGGPWSANVVDGVLYGCGATDNKSGVLAFNKAARAFLQVRGTMPVNLSDKRHPLQNAALLRTVRATFTAHGSSLSKAILCYPATTSHNAVSIVSTHVFLPNILRLRLWKYST